jgi:hypothetical protein
MGLGLPALTGRNRDARVLRISAAALLIVGTVTAVAAFALRPFVGYRYAAAVQRSVAVAQSAPAVTVNRPTAPTLANVSANELAKGAIALVAPQAVDTPTISPQKAGATALHEFPFAGSGVRQVLLARVRYTGAPGRGNELCWVVDLTPPPGGFPIGAGAPGTAPPPARWFVVFINAVTGDLVFAHAAA